MTRNFIATAAQLRETVVAKKAITDVMLMIELEFNPETWRHWRAKFIELYEEVTYTEDDLSYRIVCDKKQKLWTKQDV